jgi:hypothetical protein
MLRPASRHMSTRREASLASLSPQAFITPAVPKVPVPRVRTGTLNPDLPSCLYSMVGAHGEEKVDGLLAQLKFLEIQGFACEK